jgi:hypothetical protein
MAWEITDAAIDAAIAAYARTGQLAERLRVAAAIRAAVPHVIAERVAEAGEDSGSFDDWWMDMVVEAADPAVKRGPIRADQVVTHTSATTTWLPGGAR